MNLLNEPVQFTREQLDKIEEVRKCKWVIDTEDLKFSNVIMSIFYGDEEHPISKSRYFALFYHIFPEPENGKISELRIRDGSWVEDLEIAAVEAENGDVIFSSYRHHYNTSPDKSVFIDGGRAYTRTTLTGLQRIITVKDGNVIVT